MRQGHLNDSAIVRACCPLHEASMRIFGILPTRGSADLSKCTSRRGVCDEACSTGYQDRLVPRATRQAKSSRRARSHKVTVGAMRIGPSSSRGS